MDTKGIKNESVAPHSGVQMVVIFLWLISAAYPIANLLVALLQMQPLRGADVVILIISATAALIVYSQRNISAIRETFFAMGVAGLTIALVEKFHGLVYFTNDAVFPATVACVTYLYYYWSKKLTTEKKGN